MNDDRELLEKAAKAVNNGAWHPLTHDTPNGAWNPLTDDGDALRLAAKLGIDVTYKAFGEDEVMTSASEDQFDGWFTEPYGDDKLAATRRAIVRAAAEIGRAMP
jgi:hypothetical protein